MTLEELLNNAPAFTIDASFAIAKENGRLDFLKKFPRNELDEMFLDQYCHGTGGLDSFCYWLEYKDILFGIGGGNASKFGLYKSGGAYIVGVRSSKHVVHGEALEDAFSAVKNHILDTLSLAESGKVDQIASLGGPLWDMVLLKILSIYLPDSFVRMGSSEVIITCARELGLLSTKFSNNTIWLNHAIHQKLRSEPAFEGWSEEKLSAYLWQMYSPLSKRGHYLMGVRQGEQDQINISKQMFAQGVVALDFHPNINLEDYYGLDNKQLEEAFAELGISTDVRQLKSFLSLQPGDQIAVKQKGTPSRKEGFLSIIGIAEVVERQGKVYSYDPGNLCHRINVNFRYAPVYREFPFGGYGRAIHSVKEEHIAAIFAKDYDYSIRITGFQHWLENIYKQSHGPALTPRSIKSYMGGMTTIDKDLHTRGLLRTDSIFWINDMASLITIKNIYFDIPQVAKQNETGKQMYSNSFQRYLEYMQYETMPIEETDGDENPELKTIEMSHNLILYGPPGTGKTYTTIIRASEIIAQENISEDRFGYAKQLFNQHLGERIEFITFHQNYSYEDFVQGLRPNVELTGSLSFERRDGVFMRMAVNALFEYYKVVKLRNKKFAATPMPDPQEVYLEFADSLRPKIGTTQFEGISETILELVGVNSNHNLSIRHQNGHRSYIVSMRRLLNLYAVFDDIDMISNLKEDIKGVIGGCNFTAYWAVLKAFIDFYEDYMLKEEGRLDIEDPYTDLSYETKKELVFSIPLKELSLLPNEVVPNYVLVIDEINRANISKVFGELITLLEKDKRSHGDLALVNTLPSGEKFIVPSNLFILGTMNTADRSISLLDIALRRRFEFEPLFPRYDLTEMKPSEVEVLKNINSKIKVLKGHDFQIGHAYLMDKELSLAKKMNTKIIPLLLEYFMNDEREVRGILTAAGLTVLDDHWPLMVVAND